MDLEGKTWPEVFLSVFKDCKENLNLVEGFIKQLEDNLIYGNSINELEEYVETYQNKVHIPTWNKAELVNPCDCKVICESYLFSGKGEENHIWHGWWNEKDKTFNTRVDGHEHFKWTLEEIGYWIPVVYPTPY